MPTAHLADRGVVTVTGEEARPFLDGLVTCDLARLAPGRPVFGALLTPQGKILFDFIVFEAPAQAGGGFFFDVARASAADLAKRLGFYKLRAKVAIADASDAFAVIAGWAGAAEPDEAELAGDDPRLPALGWRAILAKTSVATPGDAAGDYHAHRIALGVPEGGKDFPFNDAFPHEALMDQLGGVDFDKGCYVGQEVVSRMQHRGTTRTRIVPLVYRDAAVAEPGAPVTAGDKTLGRTATGMRGRGLAMLRLDRAADALAAGQELRAGGLPVSLHKPDWVGFSFPSGAATSAA
ncbi:MAG TPA: folate-binding protein [Beijerinckiaceae bacterium]|nr:folate-binding protein [Beijerinckiaceae bacterium]